MPVFYDISEASHQRMKSWIGHIEHSVESSDFDMYCQSSSDLIYSYRIVSDPTSSDPNQKCKPKPSLNL